MKKYRKNLEIGDILAIYVKDLYFFDIFPLKDGEEFNAEKFQATYRVRSFFNNAQLIGSRNIPEEWVTLLRYDGNGRFIEYYTRTSIFILPTEIMPLNEVSDYFSFCDYLLGCPLFFYKDNTVSFDNEVKNKILSQQEKADDITDAINQARIYAIENFNAITNKQSGELVCFDTPYAYEENAIYNFTHGLSLTRNLKLKNDKNAE